MHAVAVVTDIASYGRLAEIFGALTPGLVIRHIEPGDRTVGLAWLARFTDQPANPPATDPDPR